ncbi:MAG: YitT family protein [Faecousia sp.]
MHNLLAKHNRFVSLLLVLAGNILYTLTVKLFVLPANLMSCGTTGIALVLNHLTGIPISGIILVFNIAMLAAGWLVLGRAFAAKTIFSSLFYPIFLEFLNQALGDVTITNNMILNVIFAALGLGASLGIVMRGGASTGGMDIPPLILNHYFRIPVSISLWIFDFCILLSQMLFHPLEDLLYGVLLILIISFALNKTLHLGTAMAEVKIISEKADAIRAGILSEVDRGVTVLYGRGGYLGKDTEVILSVVSNYELTQVEQLAREIDPSCFMIVSQASEVWGRGFSYGKQNNPDSRK